MCHTSYLATHLLFKYYVSKLGVGAQNPGKLADVILPNLKQAGVEKCDLVWLENMSV